MTLDVGVLTTVSDKNRGWLEQLTWDTTGGLKLYWRVNFSKKPY